MTVTVLPTTSLVPADGLTETTSPAGTPSLYAVSSATLKPAPLSAACRAAKLVLAASGGTTAMGLPSETTSWTAVPGSTRRPRGDHEITLPSGTVMLVRRATRPSLSRSDRSSEMAWARSRVDRSGTGSGPRETVTPTVEWARRLVPASGYWVITEPLAAVSHCVPTTASSRWSPANTARASPRASPPNRGTA